MLRRLGGWFGQVHGFAEAGSQLDALDDRLKAVNRALHNLLHVPWPESDRVILTGYPPMALLEDGKIGLPRRSGRHERAARLLAQRGQGARGQHGGRAAQRHHARERPAALAGRSSRPIARPSAAAACAPATAMRPGPWPTSCACRARSTASGSRSTRREWRAYAPRQRWFRTPNDAFMTGNFHVSQSLLQKALKQAGLRLGAAAAGQRLLRRLSSHRRGPGGDRGRGRRQGARRARQVREARQRARAGRVDLGLVEEPDAALRRDWASVALHCTARGRIRANRLASGNHCHPARCAAHAMYNCKKCPGYCCSYPLIALTKRDVERLAKHFRLSFKAQGQVHGRALGPQVFHAPQEGPASSGACAASSIPRSAAARSTRRARRRAAAIPAAAAATTTSCRSSAPRRRTRSSSPPPGTSESRSVGHHAGRHYALPRQPHARAYPCGAVGLVVRRGIIPPWPAPTRFAWVVRPDPRPGQKPACCQTRQWHIPRQERKN